MKLTANEIVTMHEALNKLADKELDLATSCTIARNLKELTIAKDIIDRKRNELITRHAEKSEDGTIVQDENGIKISDMPALMSQMNELFSSETELTLSTISKDALSDLKISPRDILALMNMIKEDNECTH